jgi:hypothetical protein
MAARFSLTQRDCALPFVNIDESTAVLSMDADIRYKVEEGGCPEYTVTVEARTVPAGGEDVSAIACDVKLAVVDLNDAPTIEDGQVFYILEGVSENTPVTLDPSGEGAGASVVALDDDAGQELTFEVIDGSAQAQEYFNIGSCSGQIIVDRPTAGGQLDFETQQQYSLTVQVQDNGVEPLSATATVTIHVINRNDPPEFVEGVDRFTHFSVPENSDIYTQWGASVQQVQPALSTVASDPDGDPLTYTASTAEEGVTFTTSGGYLMVEGRLNFEFRSFIYMTFQVEDDKGARISETFVLLVADGNDPPHLDTTAATVDELSADLTDVDAPLLGKVFDEDDTSFSFLGGASDYFSVHPNTGQVFVKEGAAALDYEALKAVSARRYLRIEVAGSACLNLREVQVFSSSGEALADLTASMDSVGDSSWCSPRPTCSAINCVDGDESTICHNACRAGGWLEIDLGSPTDVGSITVFNRLSWQNRIVGGSISLWNGAGGSGDLIWQDNFDTELDVYTFTEPHADPTCSSGILGYGTACCLVSCGSCGGSGCTSRPGGDSGCCKGGIQATGNSCSLRGPPCIVSSESEEPGAEGGTIPFEVTVRDAQLAESTARVLITVLDVNEPPTFANQQIAVAENIFPRAVLVTDLLTLSGTGDVLAEPAQVLSIRVVSVAPEDANDMFYLVAESTSISLNFRSGVTDFELGPLTFTVTIEVTDNGFPSIATQGQVVISLLNVNEPPVFAAASRYCLENSAVGYIVENPDDVGVAETEKVGNDLALAVTDPDFGDDAGNCCQTVVFSIDTEGQGIFDLVEGTGLIQVVNNTSLDYEGDVSSWFLTVHATNEDGLSDTADVRVYLEDVGEPPWFVEGGNAFFVSEKGLAGTRVGRMRAMDEDAGAAFTYSVSGCTGTADHSQNGVDGTTCWFTIDAQGATGCDLEDGVCGGTVRLNSDRPPQGDYEITATVTDETGLVAQYTQAIVVVAENYAPVYAGDLVSTVSEGIPPLGVIAQLRGVDDDGDSLLFEPVSTTYLPIASSQPITITYNSNSPETFPFTIQSTGATTAELKLNADTSLDFEMVVSYTVNLKVIEDTEYRNFAIANIVVTVTDVNEAPVFTNVIDRFELPESTVSGEVVGNVRASDPDTGSNGELVYTLSSANGVDAVPFVIDATTGEVSVSGVDGQPFNFELLSLYNVTIKVADGGNPSLSGTTEFRVEIRNVNEPPFCEAQSLQVLENAIPGEPFGTVVADDPDSGTVLRFALYGENSELFEVNPKTGAVALKVGKSLDFESRPEITVSAEIQDELLLNAPYSMLPFVGGAVQRTFLVPCNLTIGVVDVNDVQVDQLLPAVALSTAGGQNITLIGKNFGTLYSTSAAQVTYSNGKYTQAAECVLPGYPESNTEINCVTSAGHGGSGYVWSVVISGDAFDTPGSALSSFETSYEFPAISTVDAAPSPSQGGASVTIMGSNFGAISAEASLEVRYGTLSTAPQDWYTAEMCTIVEAHSRIECITSEGTGHSLLWTVAVEGQASAPSTMHTRYRAPTLESFTVFSIDGDEKNVLATSGGEDVHIRGADFGVAGTTVVAEYGALTSNERYSTAKCRVVEDHTVIACESVPGVGAGWHWRVAVSGQWGPFSNFTISYSPPTISFLHGPGSSKANTEGGQVVLLEGQNFGPVCAPDSIGTGCATNDRRVTRLRVFYGKEEPYAFEATSCAVTGAHNQISCVTAEGTGFDHSWKAVVQGQESDHFQANSSYARPIVSLFEGPGSLDSPTEGLEKVYIHGSGFGSTARQRIDSVTYGPSGVEYNAGNCEVVTSHAMLLCWNVAGAGKGHHWTVVIDGQVSERSRTNYGVPEIHSFTGAGATDANTDGGELVRIHGRNFGPAGLQYLEAVTYGNGAYAASECIVVSHDAIECLTSAGVGSGLHWSVTIEGQESEFSQATTSYAPPKIEYVYPAPGVVELVELHPPCAHVLSIAVDALAVPVGSTLSIYLDGRPALLISEDGLQLTAGEDVAVADRFELYLQPDIHIPVGSDFRVNDVDASSTVRFVMNDVLMREIPLRSLLSLAYDNYAEAYSPPKYREEEDGELPDPPLCVFGCSMFDKITLGLVDDCAVSSAWLGDSCVDTCSLEDLQTLTDIVRVLCKEDDASEGDPTRATSAPSGSYGSYWYDPYESFSIPVGEPDGGTDIDVDDPADWTDFIVSLDVLDGGQYVLAFDGADGQPLVFDEDSTTAQSKHGFLSLQNATAPSFSFFVKLEPSESTCDVFAAGGNVRIAGSNFGIFALGAQQFVAYQDDILATTVVLVHGKLHGEHVHELEVQLPAGSGLDHELAVLTCDSRRRTSDTLVVSKSLCTNDPVYSETEFVDYADPYIRSLHTSESLLEDGTADSEFVNAKVLGSNFGSNGLVYIRPLDDSAPWSVAQLLRHDDGRVKYSDSSIEILSEYKKGFIKVVVGERESRPQEFDDKSPEITDVRVAGGGLLDSDGGNIVQVTGKFFGVEPQLAIGGQFCDIYQNELAAAAVGVRVLECLSPKGQGSNLKIEVMVGKKVSCSNFKLSYRSPVLMPFEDDEAAPPGGGLVPTTGGNYTFKGQQLGSGHAPQPTDVDAKLAYTLGAGSEIGSCKVCESEQMCNVASPVPSALDFMFVASSPNATVQLLSLPVAYIDSTEIQAVIPPGVGRGVEFTVVVGGQDARDSGYASSGDNTYILNYNPPAVVDINPNVLDTDGSSVVTIRGSNFGCCFNNCSRVCGPAEIEDTLLPHSPYVTMDGVQCALREFSNSQIVCSAPEGQGTNVAVAVVVGGQVHIADDTLAVSYRPPTIVHFTPTHGPTAGNVSVVVHGHNFGTHGVIHFYLSIVNPVDGGTSYHDGSDTALTSSAELHEEYLATDELSSFVLYDSRSILSWNHTTIVFNLPEGQGQAKRFEVRVPKLTNAAGVYPLPLSICRRVGTTHMLQIHAHTHTHIYITHVSFFIDVLQIYMHIYIYIYYIYIYIYIYIYTDIHAYA